MQAARRSAVRLGRSDQVLTYQLRGPIADTPWFNGCPPPTLWHNAGHKLKGYSLSPVNSSSVHSTFQSTDCVFFFQNQDVLKVLKTRIENFVASVQLHRLEIEFLCLLVMCKVLCLSIEGRKPLRDNRGGFRRVMYSTRPKQV